MEKKFFEVSRRRFLDLGFKGFMIALIGKLGIRTAFAQRRIAIAGCGTAGAYYPIAAGMSRILMANIKGLDVTAEATGCSMENVRLIENSSVEFGLMTTPGVVAGMEGTDPFKKKVNMKMIATFYPSANQIVSLDKNAPKFLTADYLRGKRVCVGTPGSATVDTTREILAALGLTFKDIKEEQLSMAESISALADGNLHVGFFEAAYPTAALVDLSSRLDVKHISLSEETIRKVTAKYQWVKVVYPAGTYRGQNEDAVTVGGVTQLGCRGNLEDSFVYQVIKVLNEKREELAAVHSLLQQWTPKKAVEGIPLNYFHPGAKRYWIEIGVLKQ